MTELEKNILIIILKSQLDIENAGLKAFGLEVEWDGHAIVRGTISATKARIEEIKRQLNILVK